MSQICKLSLPFHNFRGIVRVESIGAMFMMLVATFCLPAVVWQAQLVNIILSATAVMPMIKKQDQYDFEVVL